MVMQLRKLLANGLVSAGIAVAATVLAFALVEGLCSIFLLGYDLVVHPNSGSVASHVYVQPDTLLGWINVPNTKLPEAYGRNIGISINSQSFRSAVDYDSAVPPGKVRVLCSGDSFTFGVGVDDNHTWCAALETQDPRLQTVNLGHTGWGLDQAYLFYKRDGRKLEHSVHIVAFIADDLRRLRMRRFNGYPKPLYRLQNNQLVLTGVPVYEPERRGLWFTYNSERFVTLRSVQLGRRLLFRMFGAPTTEDTPLPEGLEIMLRLFEDLDRAGQQNGQTTVFVMLKSNSRGSQLEPQLQQFLKKELGKRGIPFVDLYSEFLELPAYQLDRMLDSQWGHYSNGGYAYVAAVTYRNLVTLPRVAKQLSEVARPVGPHTSQSR
jgi:hypothetical protein